MKANLDRIFTVLVLCCITLMAGLTSAMAQTKVTYGLASPPGPYFSSVMYGKSLGFFKEEGLDLEIVGFQGGAVLFPQLANKSVTFGLVNADLLIMSADKGARYPVKFFSHVYENNLFEFVVPANSPVKTLSDLKGKKIGVGALTWGNLPISRAILADAGLVWGKDVQILPVGLGPGAWGRLTKGEVDALNLFTHQHEMLTFTGTSIRRLPVPEKYTHIFSNGLATHEDTVKDNPRLVEAFGRALAKSYFACAQAVEACAKAYWTHDPATRPLPEKETEWVKTYAHLNKTDTQYANVNAKGDRWGEYSAQSWRDFINAMKEGGQISNGALEVAQFYTNQFIDGINKFDRNAVKSKLKGS